MRLSRLTAPRHSLDFDEVAELYGRPDAGDGAWIRANFVSSLDGSAAGADGLSGTLGSESDRYVFRVLRCLTDAVLVGAGTVRAEGYVGPLVDDEQIAWRRAHDLADHPAFVLASARLDIDPETLAASPVRPVVLTVKNAPQKASRALAEFADIVVCGDDDVDPRQAAQWLAAHGHTQVLCEGGPTLFAAFAAAGVIDELCLTVAPVIVGGDHPRVATGPDADARMSLAHALRSDTGDLHLRYRRSHTVV